MPRPGRQSIQTELGEEVLCTKCRDYWPKDPEFFFFSNGKPHSWCKDCTKRNRGQCEAQQAGTIRPGTAPGGVDGEKTRSTR